MAREKGVCKAYTQGNSVRLCIPTHLADALQITKGTPLLVSIDDEGNLVVEKYCGEGYGKKHLVEVRVVGGVYGMKKHLQLGFTIPHKLVKQLHTRKFRFPILKEKIGDKFVLVFPKSD